MDRFHDSKATPTKRTGKKNNSDSVHTGKNIDNDTSKIIAPEIVPTTPATATPSIPDEMPAREIK